MALLDLASLQTTPVEDAVISYPAEGIPQSHVAFLLNEASILWADTVAGADGRITTSIHRASTDGTGSDVLAEVPATRIWF